MGEDVIGAEAVQILGILQQQLAAGQLLLQADRRGRDAVVDQVDRFVGEYAAQEAQLIHHRIADREDAVAHTGPLDHGVFVEPRLVAENRIEALALGQSQPEHVVEAGVVPAVALDQQTGRGDLVRVKHRLVAVIVAQRRAEDHRQPQPLVGDDVPLGRRREILGHGVHRLVERLAGIEEEAELPIAFVLRAGQAPALVQVELVGVDRLARNGARVHEDDLMLVAAKAAHPVEEVDVHALLDFLQRRGHPLGRLVPLQARQRRVDRAQPIARRGQPFHLDGVPGVDRPDQDRSPHGFVVRG